MNINKISVVIAILFSHGVLHAQSAEDSTAVVLASKISQRLKDSLNLSEQLRQQLYEVNMQLHDQKKVARQQWAGTDSVGIHIQRIENMRDSLYRALLPNEKYILYKQKKRRLVNNN